MNKVTTALLYVIIGAQLLSTYFWKNEWESRRALNRMLTEMIGECRSGGTSWERRMPLIEVMQ